MMHSVQVQGVITTTARTHQTAPGGKGEQMSMPLPVNGIGTVRVPIIQANSVRGLLRRAAAQIVFAEAVKTGQISRGVYLNVARGSAGRTGIDAGGSTAAQLVGASKHVFAGLFGGGPYMYPAKLRMPVDLVPITPETKALIPSKWHAHMLDVKIKDLTSEQLLTGRDDFMKVPTHDVVANWEEEYAAHASKKFSDNAAKREQKDAAAAAGEFLADSQKRKTDDLAIFAITEVINPGVPLYFGLTAKDVGEAQIGLLLESVRAWANDNALGGGAMRGRGSFAATLELVVDGKVVTSNLLESESPTYTLSQAAQGYVNALAQTLPEQAKPEKLASMYPADVPLDGDAAPAKGKRGKKAAPTDPTPAGA